MIGGYRDHSANERTYLAWVRTGIAVIAFGFVVQRLKVGRYEALVLIMSGLALVVLATVRFVRITRLLDDPQTHSVSSVRTELIVSGLLVVLVSSYTVYLAFS